MSAAGRSTLSVAEVACRQVVKRMRGVGDWHPAAEVAWGALVDMLMLAHTPERTASGLLRSRLHPLDHPLLDPPSLLRHSADAGQPDFLVEDRSSEDAGNSSSSSITTPLSTVWC